MWFANFLILRHFPAGCAIRCVLSGQADSYVALCHLHGPFFWALFGLLLLQPVVHFEGLLPSNQPRVLARPLDGDQQGPHHHLEGRFLSGCYTFFNILDRIGPFIIVSQRKVPLVIHIPTNRWRDRDGGTRVAPDLSQSQSTAPRAALFHHLNPCVF